MSDSQTKNQEPLPCLGIGLETALYRLRDQLLEQGGNHAVIEALNRLLRADRDRPRGEVRRDLAASIFRHRGDLQGFGADEGQDVAALVEACNLLLGELGEEV